MQSQNNQLQSSRLQAVLDKWTAGDTAVLHQFWREMKAQGAPLIESIDQDAKNYLVTFLWRDENRMLDTACLTEGPAGFDFHLGQMARLADTDIWYRSYQMPGDTVMLYHLSPNNPLPVWGSPEWADLWDEFEPDVFQFDPLNPLRHADGSVLRLPDAPAEPWFDDLPDSQTGQLHIHDFEENCLGRLQRVRVYLPADYRGNGRSYPWLLLFDGSTYANEIATTLLDNLIAQQIVPPLVVVFINGVWEDRGKDLSCNPAFNQFLVNEMLPLLKANFKVSEDPAETAVGGFSLGGLAAAFAAFQHPDIFGNVLAQGGFFQWSPEMNLHGLATDTRNPASSNWLIRQFVKADRLPLRFHLDVGTYDFNGQPELHSNTLVANRHLRDVLQAKGHEVDYVEFNGGHDFVGWRRALPAAIQWLLAPK
ncbi:MAG: DUF3327 domain-containing protein [Anaerolineales bacterium]|nr:DUF3327 domain-containing protein [Anaerolineales bacterium]